MNLWLILIMFVAVVGGFSLYGLWDWWKPRHDLDRLFAERRRERVAVARIPQTPEPLPHLEPVVA